MKQNLVNQIDYIISYRESHPVRKQALQFVVHWLQHFFPELHIVIVEQDDTPKLSKSEFPQCDLVFVYNPYLFNRSWALNVGAQHGDNELLGFGDADIFLPQETYLSSWQALQTWDAVSPKTRVLNVDRIDFTHLTFQEISERFSTFAGGILMIRRERFEFLGGWNEAFEGWGDEDEIMSDMIHTLLNHHTLDSDAFHVDHPRSVFDGHSQPNYAHNRALWDKIGALSKSELLAHIAQIRKTKIGDPNKYLNQEFASPVAKITRPQPLVGVI